MNVFEDMTKLVDARLRSAKQLYKKIETEGRPFSRDDLNHLEQLYSEVEELHELIVTWVDKNKVPVST